MLYLMPPRKYLTTWQTPVGLRSIHGLFFFPNIFSEVYVSVFYKPFVVHVYADCSYFHHLISITHHSKDICEPVSIIFIFETWTQYPPP